MTEVIVALDVPTLEKEEALLKKLKGTISFYKVGLQLFTAHGKRAVDLVREHGGKVFLDLKLHDIPQTVALAVEEAAKLGVESLSLHLSGGQGMLEAAAQVPGRPKLWGVTVLTSLGPDDVKIYHTRASVPNLVRSLARMGQAHGADGIICSPQEVALVRKALRGAPVKFITPGIRPAGGELNDQRRVTTPQEAAREGIDYIVVGRPITHASDPLKAAQDILNSMLEKTP